MRSKIRFCVPNMSALAVLGVRHCWELLSLVIHAVSQPLLGEALAALDVQSFLRFLLVVGPAFRAVSLLSSHAIIRRDRWLTINIVAPAQH